MNHQMNSDTKMPLLILAMLVALTINHEVKMLDLLLAFDDKKWR